jgi:ribosomal protein L21E
MYDMQRSTTMAGQEYQVGQYVEVVASYATQQGMLVGETGQIVQVDPTSGNNVLGVEVCLESDNQTCWFQADELAPKVQ